MYLSVDINWGKLREMVRDRGLVCCSLWDCEELDTEHNLVTKQPQQQKMYISINKGIFLQDHNSTKKNHLILSPHSGLALCFYNGILAKTSESGFFDYSQALISSVWDNSCLFLIVTTLTHLQITGQLFCRMLCSLGSSPSVIFRKDLL